MMAAFPPHPSPVVNREILSCPRVDRERARLTGGGEEEEMRLNEFAPLANCKKPGVRVGHVQIFVGGK